MRGHDIPASPQDILEELRELRAALIEAEMDRASQLEEVAPCHRAGAVNLVHYLALRQHDIRNLQAALTRHGLSSLGRIEAHVMATLDAVCEQLGHLPESRRAWPDFESGERLLREHKVDLFGPEPNGRRTHIMVTMSTEAATNYDLVRNMLAAGMNCMRINTAHDGPTEWAAMIAHLRRAEAELGVRCRVSMDLAGPKLRTGPIAPGPAVMKWRPERDAFGRVVTPARIWLTDSRQPAAAPGPASAVLPIVDFEPAALVDDDLLELVDTRDAERTIEVVAVLEDGVWAEARSTAYVAPGTRLVRRGGDPHLELTVGEVPAMPRALLLKENDLLEVNRAQIPGEPATYDHAGLLLHNARIACTLPEAFDSAAVGDRIWFDDGIVGGVIQSISAEHMLVRITEAPPRGVRLLPEKGINLPDTDLPTAALTADDLACLPFIAANADIVALSFVRSPADVHLLQAQLAALGRPEMPIILKIETRKAFEQLPELLFAAMRSPVVGVMIARGDLAVECGFERLAELQEETLWLCEAAHVPAIWATQVLETLARTGVASRAEITDAAMGERAECVMLNKGPFIVKTIEALDDILRRMEGHQRKKVALLRRLRSWSLVPG